eukprot:TRINITY_DN1685_c0_g1_i1.p1 TRINITY_DN1685_c0_g1~~TRINITY_DN1685_c0_g1_i1.p1  ORF type:complete len:400 (+),score=92.63 TRINITY_DN1685_c0_g1_i1:146-1345(+)
MSVIIDTSMGTITIDLYVEDCPKTCLNFIKLCKMKYYHNCLFFNIQRNFIIQTGDPTNTGEGGSSIYGLLSDKDEDRYFDNEIKPYLKHSEIGTVSMANKGEHKNASQFFITTGSHLDALDEKHTIFGAVGEGFDTLMKINDAFTDNKGKPLQVIRIKHCIILDDPFDDLDNMKIPSRSPSPEIFPGLLPEYVDLEVDIDLKEDRGEDVKEEIEKKEAVALAEALELMGDVPHADIKPPDNVLFVCKLNPITTEESLNIIFSKYGKLSSCEIIKDKKSGDSLCYAFVEYDDSKSCEEAFFKTNNSLIDDRRIHVDFSQSVSKVAWGNFSNKNLYKHSMHNNGNETRSPRRRSRSPRRRSRKRRRGSRSPRRRSRSPRRRSRSPRRSRRSRTPTHKRVKR